MSKICIFFYYFLCSEENGAIPRGFAASGLYHCFNRTFFITFASSATSEFGFGEPLKIEFTVRIVQDRSMRT